MFPNACPNYLLPFVHHTLEVGAVKVASRIPLSGKTAFRPFEIQIEWCAFAVYIFVAVVFACAFRFSADFA
jgi:hypothetical protein